MLGNPRGEGAVHKLAVGSGGARVRSFLGCYEGLRCTQAAFCTESADHDSPRQAAFCRRRRILLRALWVVHCLALAMGGYTELCITVQGALFLANAAWWVSNLARYPWGLVLVLLAPLRLPEGPPIDPQSEWEYCSGSRSAHGGARSAE